MATVKPPDVRMWLDDGSGTYPFEVTQWVRLSAGLTIESGRSDELDDRDPTIIKLRLDNHDGRFTLGSPQYGCYVDQPARLWIGRDYAGNWDPESPDQFALPGVTRVHHGVVDDWPTKWADPTALTAYAEISVVDAQARLQRTPLVSNIDTALRARVYALPEGAASAYYPLTEPAGATAAGESLGVIPQPLLQQIGSGIPVTFGDFEGLPYDPGASAVFSNGRYLTTSNDVEIPGSGTSLVAFVNFTMGNIAPVKLIAGTVLLDVGVNASGMAFARYIDTNPDAPVSVTVTAPATPFNDGQWHAIGAHVTEAGFLSLTYDGLGTNGYGGGARPLRRARLQVGKGFTGAVSHVMIGNPNSTADQYTFSWPTVVHGGLDGWAPAPNFPNGASWSAVVAAAGVEVSSFQIFSGIYAPHDVAGKSAWEALQEVADGDGGWFEIDRRSPRAIQFVQLKSVRDAARSMYPIEVSAKELEPDDFTLTGDRQFLVNRATANREGGAEQVAVNQASFDRHGDHSKSLGTLLVGDDEAARDRCAWTVNVYGEPRARLSSFTIDILANAADGAFSLIDLQYGILLAGLGARIVISDLPAQALAPLIDLLAEGRTETISDTEWTLSFNTSPAVLQQVFTLDDATFGVLDGPYPIAF